MCQQLTQNPTKKMTEEHSRRLIKRAVEPPHLTMLRSTMPTLDALALRNPGHEKVTSFREDIAQPPMIGSSDAHTASGGYACPSSGADSSTENTCQHH